MPDSSHQSVLVFGGCGFIGSHVVDRFAAAGHPVRVLDRSREVYRAPVPGVEYVIGDFGNRSLVAEVVKNMDIVVHLISTTVPSTSNDDPVFDVESNLMETIACFQRCVAAGVRKVVFLSSGGAVYGNPESCPVAEEALTNPLCSYGIVKLAVEKYLALFHLLNGLDYCVIRASNPFGPRQNPFGGQGVIAAMLAHMALGCPVEIWGDGRVVRDFLYVSDLASAIYAAALSSRKSQIYNVGSGTGLSLLEVLDCIGSALSAKLAVNFKAGRAFDVQRIYLDTAKARAELAWSPQVPIEEGIRLTWDFLRQVVQPEHG